MIKDLLQTCLDNVLLSKKIYVHEQKKSGKDADQYVVYSVNGDEKSAYADDTANSKNASVTVKYFYRESKLETHASKVKVREIEDLIESTLESSGFEIPFGRFDAGDIDGIGYMVTVFECEYWRVI
jgi:hypothetical protein